MATLSGLPGISVGVAVDPTGVSTGLNKAGRELDKFANATRSSMRGLRGNFQNLSFQIQDVAVQMQMGTDAMRIFVQQGSQIASIFGPAGAAVGILIAALGAGATAFGAFGASANQTKKALDDLDESVLGTAKNLDETIEKYRTATEEQRTFLGTAKTRELDELAKSIREQGVAAQGAIEHFRAAGGGITELRKIAREAFEDFQAAGAGLAALGASIGAQAKVANPFADLDEELKATVEGIIESSASLGEMSTRIAQFVHAMGEEAPPALIEFDKALRGSTATMAATTNEMKLLEKELELLGLTSVKTTKEIEAQFNSLTGISEDVIRSGNQARFQAAQKAEREAERLAEERARREIQRTETLYNKLGDIAASTIRSGNQAQFQAAKDAEREQLRLRERAADQRQRLLEAEAERNADLLLEPYLNFISAAQSSLAGFFEEIFSGGVKSFEDLFAEAKRLVIRFAAEAAALMVFRPDLATGLLGGLGAAGAAGGAAGFGAGFRSPGGLMIPALGGTSVAGSFGAGFTTPGGLEIPALGAAPWWRRGALGGGGLVAAGGLGALGGGLIGQQFGGFGGVGGGLGGAAGAVLGGLTPFGPLGAAAGGLAGGLLGGGIGSLFGGGSQSNKVGIRGGLGISGQGAAAQFVAGIDASLQQLLDITQEATANRVLEVAEAVRVEYSKKLSANDMARLAKGRIGPVAGALGFDVEEITKGTGEQQLASLQQALAIQKQLEGFRIGPIETQFRDLKDQFDALEAEANRLGVSTKGLSEEYAKQFELLSLGVRSQKIAFEAGAGVISEYTASQRALTVEYETSKMLAEQYGTSIKDLKAAFKEAQQALRLQRREEKIQFQQSVGVISQFDAELQLLTNDFRQSKLVADEYGVSVKELTAGFEEARQSLKLTQASQKVELLASLGLISADTAALRLLNYEFEQLKLNAEDYGLTITEINRAQKAATHALIEANKERRRLEAEQERERKRAEAEAERERRLAKPLETFQRREEKIQFAQSIGALNEFQAQDALLRNTFRLWKHEAKEFGFSLKDVIAGFREAKQLLRLQQQTEIIQTKATLGIIDDYTASQKLLKIQFAEVRLRADELGISIRELNEAFKQAQATLRLQRREEKIQFAQSIGVLDEFQAEDASLRNTFRQWRQEAEELGFTLEQVADGLRRARKLLDLDQAARTISFKQSIGLINEFTASQQLLKNQFRQWAVVAEQFGVTIEEVTAAQTRAMRELKRQQQAELDSIVLAIIEPFKELSEPLRDFSRELELSLLNPLQRLQEAQEHWDRTLALSIAGNVDAIRGLADAGRDLIHWAEVVGASPLVATKTREVSAGISKVTVVVDDAMLAATKGISSEVRDASKREIDTLRELIEVGQQQIDEIKKLARALR